MINLSNSKCGQNVYRMLHKIHLVNLTSVSLKLQPRANVRYQRHFSCIAHTWLIQVMENLESHEI